MNSPRPFALLVVLALGTATAVPLTAQSSEPGPMSGHRMVYDPHGKRMLMYSGVESGRYRSRLWAWDGERWSALTEGGPPGRDDEQIGFDTRRRRLVLHGGRQRGPDRDHPAILSDTWEWDGAAWRLADSGTTGQRLHGGMAYDRSRGVMVLFGGFGVEPEIRADTWEWDGASWKRRADGPVRRWVDAVVTDPAGRGVVLLAAMIDSSDRATGTNRAELWRWDGSVWARADSAPSLSPQLPLSETGDGLLLYDGWEKSRVATTWTWDGRRWSPVPGEGPSPRRSAAMAYDSGRKRVVLFGGETEQSELGDLWEFDGRAWMRRRPLP